jgi:hypothetical protein
MLKVAAIFTISLMSITGCSMAPLKASVQVGPTVTTSTSSYMTIGQQRWTYTVAEADVTDSPAWVDPSSNPPPLPESRAVALSRAELSKYMPEVETWDLVNITLEPLGYSSKWFYVVAWRPRGLDKGDNLGIPVLMSGRAVALRPNE